MIDAAEATSRLRVGHASTGDVPWSVEWVTRPNVSLTPRQLLAAFAVVAGFSLAVAGFFWAQGVWLVLPFAGLELIGIAAALVVHARHVGDAERIVVQAEQVTIDRRHGAAQEHIELAPHRVRVERPQGADDLVRLSAAGRQVAVGRHLQRHLRPQLAEELNWALRNAHRAA